MTGQPNNRITSQPNNKKLPKLKLQDVNEWLDELITKNNNDRRELEATIARMQPIVNAVLTAYTIPGRGAPLILWRKLIDDYERAEIASKSEPKGA